MISLLVTMSTLMFTIAYVAIGIMYYVKYYSYIEKRLKKIGFVLLCGPGVWILFMMEQVFNFIDWVYFSIESRLTKK